MKKIIIIMFVLFAQNIHAQNVGIGTTTPAARLDVKTPDSYVAQFNGGGSMFMGIFENDIYRGYWGSYAGADEDVDFGTGFGNVLGKLHLTIQASPKLTIDVNGNVGIGTITPSVANKLHVHDGVANQDASIGITNSLTTDGNLRGARLRMLNSDFQIMNYEATGAINLATNFNTRLTITANGNVGINNLVPAYALQVTAKNKYGIYTTATINGTDTIAGIYGLAQSPTPVPYSAGVRGESNSTNYNGIGVLGIQGGSGWGVAGFIKEEGLSGLGYGAGVFGAAGYQLTGGGTGGYGVYGHNSNTGGTAGFFYDMNGSATSYALKALGKLKFNGIGEASGKVLTSDATGNASWANLPGGANAWTVSGNNIYNSNAGYVGIGTNTPQYLLHVEAGARNGIYARSTITTTDSAAIIGVLDVPSGANFRAAGVKGESKSTTSNSIGVYGIHNGGGFGVAGSVKEAGLSGWGAGVYGEAGLNGFASGTGGYGVYGANTNTGGTAGYFINNSSSTNSYALHAKTGVATTAAAWLEGNGGSGIAVEIDGAIKVNTTASNRPTFTHVTAAGNIAGNYSSITYPNPLSSDFVMVVPNYTAGPVYNNHPIGVFFTLGKWAIFNQDLVAMPVGVAFNVLVIRQ